ncbi:unnamed protein product [Fusarium venenatum]|uniref:Uncharacterized protein n=1 Tax=Fusarium venenatum TaxID=56646 RepID=A0A2L2TQT7_9HYPO|nr:uncharacterized protein FVRRES_02418 [Fusarium venenatum]CEI65906.1 unnamed protein product [Fusarium venenatum]
MATRATAREIGTCIAAACYFKCPKFIKVFIYRAILYADEFSEGNAWIEDGISVASDIEGPEYTLILETYRIWPFQRLLGSMMDVWAKMESAAMENPHYARDIRDLQVRMKDLVAKTQSNCDIDVQYTQSMQSLLRCNK